MLVSSTNIFHSLGFKGKESMAFFSKYSIYKIGNHRESGDPITTPSVCSYMSP
jgi:hypothetical protein